MKVGISALQHFAADNFSVRWTGQLEAEFDETYQFFARSSDGFRMWLDGALIIDRWQDQATSEVASSGQTLNAGQRYDIIIEYYESTGEAQAHLSWSSVSTPKSIVPTSALFPDPLVSAVGPGQVLPANLEIASTYPNPAYGYMTVEYSIPEAGLVGFEIFDSIGRRVGSIEPGTKLSGVHRQQIDLASLAAGSYLIRVRHGLASTTRGFAIVR